MAQKKCPKCGEDNPAEAVMCWACYTPLSGGATAAPGPARVAGPGGAPGQPSSVGDEGGEKKKLALDPKMIGVGAFIIVGGGLAFVLNSGMLGGGGEDSGGDAGTTTAAQPNEGGGGGAPPPPNPVSSGPSAGPSFAGGTVPAPVPLPYTTVVQPNPRYQTGTLGILPSNTAITGIQAASLAKFAKSQFTKSGKWTGMQIVVFTDANSARAFADYQARKRGSPLQPSDYKTLADTDMWRSTPAYYQSSGTRERVDYPAKNPYSWWQNVS